MSTTKAPSALPASKQHGTGSRVVLHRYKHEDFAHLAAATGLKIKVTSAHCPPAVRRQDFSSLAESKKASVQQASEHHEAKGRPITEIYDPFFPYPVSCIGKIQVGQYPDLETVLSEGCGAMVQPALVLTASHTIPWTSDQVWWMRFIPSYSYGNAPYGIANIFEAHGIQVGPQYSYPSPIAYDMAICKVDQDIGERCGWMAVLSSTNDAFYTSEAPIDNAAGCAGYNEQDSSNGRGLHYEVVNNGIISGVDDDGAFKLLTTETNPIRESFTDAIMWTNYQGTECAFGVRSGAFDSEGGGEDGYAAGPGLGQLWTWGDQNFGGT